MSRRTEMAYKATLKGKVARHTKALGSGDRVNAALVEQQFTLLNFPEGTLFNRVNVLIRGDLSNGAAYLATGVGLRAISKGVELPPNPWCEWTEVSRGHSSRMPGVMPGTW
jgi:hypothetical protein